MLNDTFKCIVFDPASKTLAITQKKRPSLKASEVLVKVWGSPINPSDRLFCQGLYGSSASHPITPGFEGTGTVVACGNSFWAKRLVGKNISGAIQGQDGFWAEYVVLPAQQCLELNSTIDRDSAACAFVNPLTALALMEPISKGKFKSFVQTAAASQLGRMIQKLAKKAGVPAVHIVHRPQLKLELEAEGWEHVLDSSQADFENKLRDFSEKLSIRYAIDAVAGAMTGSLIKNLPEKSRVIVYGVLSGQSCVVAPGDLIFKDMQVRGFWLSHWLKEKRAIELPFLFSKLKKLLKAEAQTHVTRRLTLDETVLEIAQPKGYSSEGKTLVMP